MEFIPTIESPNAEFYTAIPFGPLLVSGLFSSLGQQSPGWDSLCLSKYLPMCGKISMVQINCLPRHISTALTVIPRGLDSTTEERRISSDEFNKWNLAVDQKDCAKKSNPTDVIKIISIIIIRT